MCEPQKKVFKGIYQKKHAKNQLHNHKGLYQQNTITQFIQNSRQRVLFLPQLINRVSLFVMLPKNVMFVSKPSLIFKTVYESVTIMGPINVRASCLPALFAYCMVAGYEN